MKNILIVLFAIFLMGCHPSVKKNVPLGQLTTAITFDPLTIGPMNTPINNIEYEWIECYVSWDQACEGDVLIQAPVGFQICKALYTVANRSGNSNYSVSPRSWYTNDPESPDRYRAVNFHVDAAGDYFFFDRKHAHMKLKNVGVSVISASATNEDRYFLGCDIAPHD